MKINISRALLYLPLYILLAYPASLAGSFWVELGSFRVALIEGVLVYLIIAILALNLATKPFNIPAKILALFFLMILSNVLISISLLKSPDISQGIRLILETVYMQAFTFFGYILARKDGENRIEKALKTIFLVFTTWNYFLLLTGLGFDRYDETQDYFFFFTIYGKHGAFLCSIICVYYLFGFYEKKPSYMDIFFILSNVMFLLLTGSRTAIFSAFIAVCLTLVIHKKLNPFQILSFSVLSLIALALVPFLPIANHYFHNGELNMSWSGRIPFWIRASEVWLDSGALYFGLGQGFTRAWLLENQNSDVISIGALHNELLRITIESGIVGIAGYLGFLFALVAANLKGLQSRLILLSTYCLVQFIVASIPELTTMLYLVYGQYVFVIAGVALGYRDLRERNQTEKNQLAKYYRQATQP